MTLPALTRERQGRIQLGGRLGQSAEVRLITGTARCNSSARNFMPHDPHIPALCAAARLRDGQPAPFMLTAVQFCDLAGIESKTPRDVLRRLRPMGLPVIDSLTNSLRVRLPDAISANGECSDAMIRSANRIRRARHRAFMDGVRYEQLIDDKSSLSHEAAKKLAAKYGVRNP